MFFWLKMILMLPNIFTIFRLLSSFIIVGLYLFTPSIAFELILPVYILAAISDYFDGKLARKYNVITTFGKCFDIIADKALVLTILLIAMEMKSAHIIFVFIILFREFTVSGLREVLAGSNIQIPASRLGKWKTGFQMTVCGFAVGQFAHWATSLLEWTFVLKFVVIYVQEITLILFVISSVLTILSGMDYIKGVFQKNQ